MIIGRGLLKMTSESGGSSVDYGCGAVLNLLGDYRRMSYPELLSTEGR